MRHPILSRPLRRRTAMEPIRVRSYLRRDRLRCLRIGDIGDARAAFADPCFDAARKNVLACLNHLCARAKLDLFAAALAQLLAINE